MGSLTVIVMNMVQEVTMGDMTETTNITAGKACGKSANTMYFKIITGMQNKTTLDKSGNRILDNYAFF